MSKGHASGKSIAASAAIACLALALVLAAPAPSASARSGRSDVPATNARDSGNLHGQLTDNAVVVKNITGATVTVGGKTVKANSKGRFDLQGIASGQQNIVVKAPQHADYRSTLLVQSGDNQVTVALDLTVLETYKRNFTAYSHRQYHVSYQIIHPDIRALYTYAQYVAYMKTVPDVVSYKILRSKKLASWYADYLQKTYTNVWAITRVLRYHDSSGYFKDDPLTMHWAQVDGRWYAIFNWQLTSGHSKGGHYLTLW